MPKGSRGGKITPPANKKASGTSAKTAPKAKMTKAQITKLSRAEMEKMAKAIYIQKNVARGLSQSEATYRFNSLISGNSKTALIKYIYKNQ